MTFSSVRLAIPILLIGLLTACSGGESGTGLASTQPKISVGAITDFGSVFVNGIEFDTTGADVYVNNSAGTERDLSIGMVVAVVGSSNQAQTSGNARAIYYENEVRGIVRHNEQAGLMDVMGQSVTYDADTVFNSAVNTVKTIADIPIGAVVEVSGYRIGENTLHATHMALVATAYSAGSQFTVKGIIESVNSNGFALGTLDVIVDSSTRISNNIANLQLTPGMNIKVTSRRALLNGALQADSIQLNKVEYAVENASVEMEGIITNLNRQAGNFRLNSYLVNYSDQTELGTDGAALAEGVKAEVEGVLISDSRIQAKEIDVQSNNNTDLIARINSVDTAKNQVTILGAGIQATNKTLMKDDDLKIKKFSLSQVNSGDKVEIKAIRNNVSDTIVARQFIRITANSTDTAVELKGVLEQYSATKIKVAGISVDITSVSQSVISAADVGRTITVKGTAIDNATEITATEISI